MGKIITSLNGTYKVYPRGFLGSVQSPTVERTNSASGNDMVGLIGRMHYDVNLFDASKSTRITANMTIDSLWRECVRRGSQSFDFREKAIQAALYAFGTRNFYEWYRVQFDGPSFGDTQRRFLEDTFKFIYTGRRDLPLVNWNSLVTAGESNDGNKTFTPYASKFFVLNDNQQPLRPVSVADVIQCWLSREGGFNDMLFTLFILFGVAD